jgi:hypothetical protein
VASPASAFVASFVGAPPNSLVPAVIDGIGTKVGGRLELFNYTASNTEFEAPD